MEYGREDETLLMLTLATNMLEFYILTMIMINFTDVDIGYQYVRVLYLDNDNDKLY